LEEEGTGRALALGEGSTSGKGCTLNTRDSYCDVESWGTGGTGGQGEGRGQGGG
jgi:hypothetical protein